MMKVIDFEKKGNVVRFYLGDDACDDYWGDDWDDIPYEHNASEVYDEFVKGFLDVAFPFDAVVFEPGDDWEYGGNSPYCKEDFKKGKAPCIVATLLEEHQYEWGYQYSKMIGDKSTVKIYFNDSEEDVRTKVSTIEEPVFRLLLWFLEKIRLLR